jgi:hypothetical protein
MTQHQDVDRCSCQWRVHPARQQLGRAVAVGLCVLLVLALMMAVEPRLVVALPLGVLFLASLGEFFFPTRYVVDEQGLVAYAIHRDRKLRWSDVKELRFDSRGAWLTIPAGSWGGRLFGGDMRVLFAADGGQARRLIEECWQRARGA